MSNKQESLPIGEPAREIISQRGFAKLVGVAQPSIAEAIAAGRLSAACVANTKQGKQLYVELALAEWQQLHPDDEVISTSYLVPDGIAGNLSLEGEADSRDLNTVQWGKLRTKREALVAGEKAKLLYLERCELQGKMHRSEDVEAAWGEIITAARSKLLALAGDVAGAIAVKTKRDRIVVQQIVEREVEKLLLELSGDVDVKIAEHRKRRVSKKS